MSKIIKAKMSDNLVSAYQSCEELTYHDGSNEFDLMSDDDQCAIVGFLSHISGQVVELVFIGNDAFEINNNNYWLPNSLWVACHDQAIGAIGGDV
ncbi:MAG TPA: hypothetical protein GX732_01025 [Pseudomonas sp.]|nr:hypothetical protein [Pseudomonas sp.]